MTTVTITNQPVDRRAVCVCDFCGASQYEVSIMISSERDCHICGNCVAQCVSTIAHEMVMPK